MLYYLYWDESAEGDGSKLFRSTYSTLEEAKAQAEADMTCKKCNGEGEEDTAWGAQACRVCEGSGESWYRNIVGIEESESELGGASRASIQRGTFVWKPGDK